MKSRLLIPVLVAIFLAFLFFFFSSELTPGMRADTTDWSMYVMHARNIATGQPYARTGYVFQPESTTEVGANSYPSGFPLMLAPVYAVNGLNIRLFKLLNVVFLVLSLWVTYVYARRTLSPGHSFLLITALGMSRVFVPNFDLIGSDAPYQLVSLLVLLLLLRINDRHLSETNPWAYGLLAGLGIAAAYLIRPIGLAFLVAVFGAELLRKRRPTIFFAAIIAVFIPLMLLNNLRLHTDSSYANQFVLSIPQIVRHAVSYVGFFSYAFASPLGNAFRYLLWLIAMPLAVLAVVMRVRRGIGVTELYVATLLAVDSVYWAADARYLMPVMPIFLVYVFEGFEEVARRSPRPFVLRLTVAAAVLLLCAPVANTLLVRTDPGDTLVGAPRFEELCAATRRQTVPDALIIFWNPRVFAFSTGRFASGWPAEGPPERMISYLHRVHPNYIIEDKSHPDDRKFLIPVLAAAPFHLVTVYENAEFSLMHLDDAK